MFCSVLMKCSHLLKYTAVNQHICTWKWGSWIYLHNGRNCSILWKKPWGSFMYIERVTASLPKVPPVDQHSCHSVHLSCLGSLDHITHGFKSITHKHQGPAALSVVTCSFLTYFCVLLALIQLSQQERVWVSRVRHTERLLWLNKWLTACQINLQQCNTKDVGQQKRFKFSVWMTKTTELWSQFQLQSTSCIPMS